MKTYAVLLNVALLTVGVILHGRPAWAEIAPSSSQNVEQPSTPPAADAMPPVVEPAPTQARTPVAEGNTAPAQADVPVNVKESVKGKEKPTAQPLERKSAPKPKPKVVKASPKVTESPSSVNPPETRLPPETEAPKDAPGATPAATTNIEGQVTAPTSTAVPSAASTVPAATAGVGRQHDRDLSDLGRDAISEAAQRKPPTGGVEGLIDARRPNDAMRALLEILGATQPTQGNIGAPSPDGRGLRSPNE